jgi:hypothetical protein
MFTPNSHKEMTNDSRCTNGATHAAARASRAGQWE